MPTPLPSAASGFEDWVISDLAGWVGVAFMLAAAVIAFLALRKKLTYVTFGPLWRVTFWHIEKNPEWGRLKAQGKMAVTLVGSSFHIKQLTCKASSGSSVEINLEDRGSEGNGLSYAAQCCYLMERVHGFGVVSR